jgi:hypothetical protein
MKNQAFFEAIAAQGIVQALHASLAEQPNFMLMVVKRLERLEQSLKAGGELTEDLLVEKNQISHSILSLLDLDDIGAGQENFKQLGKLLNEHLGISAASEQHLVAIRETNLAKANEAWKAKALQLKDQAPLSFEPIPDDELLPLDGIAALLRTDQLLLALRHSLRLAEPSIALPRVKLLMHHYQELDRNRHLGLVSDETISLEENRLKAALHEILGQLAKPPEAPKKSFWQKLWS